MNIGWCADERLICLMADLTQVQTVNARTETTDADVSGEDILDNSNDVNPEYQAYDCPEAECDNPNPVDWKVVKLGSVRRSNED
jgi:hypothetical protein